jgi:hypothetical protein
MPSANGLGIMCETYKHPRTKVGTVTGSAGESAAGKQSGASVPKGFLVTSLYSFFVLVFPILNEYVTYDYDTTLVRTGVIVASVLGASFVALANDCVAWFNMVLWFHIGVEVTVLDKVYHYASKDGIRDSEAALAWVGFAVIIFHLIPFLILDYEKVLCILAYAGVIVNSSVLVFVDPSKLLVAASTSTSLLLSVMLIACIDCVKTSYLSQLKIALSKGNWIRCANYEM